MIPNDYLLREKIKESLLEGTIKEIFNRLSLIEEKLNIQHEPKKHRVTIEDDPLEKVSHAMDGLFHIEDTGTSFTSLHDAYTTLTGDPNVSGIHNTTCVYPEDTFTKVFLKTLNRYMLDQYNSFDHSWRDLVRIRLGTRDFKHIPIYQHTSDPLEKYTEGTYETKMDRGYSAQEKTSYKVEIRGKCFIITQRMILNDDRYYIQRMLEEMARSAYETIQLFVFSLLIGGSEHLRASSNECVPKEKINTDRVENGSRELYTLRNGQSLVLSKFSLQEAMRRMKTASSKYLVVPYELQYSAEEFGRHYPLEIYVVDKRYLGNSAKNWYMVPDPKTWESIQLAFLDDNEDPKIKVTNSYPSSRSIFTGSGLECSISHNYGGVVVGHEGLFGSIVYDNE